MKTLSLLVVLALLSSLGCQPAARTVELRPNAMIFEVFRINYAWGFSCGGCYVDASGNVHRYDCSALRDTIKSQEWRGREAELLQRRFQMNDSILCRVSVSELNDMRVLIDKASKTPPSEEKQTANDAGATSFRGFLYASGDGDSTELVLATSGDFSREPSSVAATQLVEWLQQKCSCKDSVGNQ